MVPKLKKLYHKIYKFIPNWLIPNSLFIILFNLLHNFLISRIPSNNKNAVTSIIKKYKRNNRCIIIANGPSVAQFDLKKIPNNCDVISINQFYKSEVSNHIKSDFHIVNEPFDGNQPEDTYKYILNQCLKHESACYIFHPNSSRYLKTKKNVFFSKNSLLKIFTMQFGSLTLDKRMPLFKCTGSASIAYAIAIGYQKIYVLGMDQNQLSEKKQTNRHFYEEEDNHKYDIQKFENYYQRIISKSETILSLLRLTKIAKDKDIKIYNLSYKYSFIDFWQPYDFEKLS